MLHQPHAGEQLYLDGGGEAGRRYPHHLEPTFSTSSNWADFERETLRNLSRYVLQSHVKKN